MILEGSNFFNQAICLPWNRNVHPPKEDDRYENDSCDSFIYAYRRARHYVYKEPAKELTLYEEKQKRREEYAERLQAQERERESEFGFLN